MNNNYNNNDDDQLWGQCPKITASRRRHHVSVKETSSISPSNIALERINTSGDYSEDENLFDFIGRQLDEREEEARREQQQQQQQQCLQQQDGSDNTNNYHMENTAVFSQASSHNDELDFLPMMDNWSVADGNGMNDSPAENERKEQLSNNDIHHHQLDATEDNDAIAVPRTTSKRRREYSVVKSTTPRFSFQSSSKSTSTTGVKSPMERHSNSFPLPSSTSDTKHPKKSAKRMHRHSFRQSMDRKASNTTASMTQVNSNMRELGFAPKFLASSRAAGFANHDAISSQLADGEGDDDDAPTKRQWNRLSSSQVPTSSPYKQSSSSRRNNGYLIQNLRSLRNNDQRMAMRLRASTGGYSNAPMASKRRRSGSSGFSNLGPKQVAASELDVTVMAAAVPNQNVNESPFGSGKISLAYIRRYTGTVNIKLPCYSWIVLSQNVMHEQSIGEGGGGGSTQLRFYDAVIIPPRVASIDSAGRPVPFIGLEEHELPLPIIICANVCEQYTNAMPMPALHDVSFDVFCK
jgi:hypothetical protein